MQRNNNGKSKLWQIVPLIWKKKTQSLGKLSDVLIKIYVYSIYVILLVLCREKIHYEHLLSVAANVMMQHCFKATILSAPLRLSHFLPCSAILPSVTLCSGNSQYQITTNKKLRNVLIKQKSLKFFD